MVTKLLPIALVVGMALESTQATTGVISGRVLLPDGRPAIGIRVGAMTIPSSENPTLDSTTLTTSIEADADGRYHLENISPGWYYITAGLINIPTYYPGVRDISGAKAVSVVAAGTVAGID